MVDMYADPVGALRELHSSFRQAALERNPLSPMRVAATQGMLDQLVAHDSSEAVRDELDAIRETTFQASRSIGSSMAWTFLSEMCDRFVREIDGDNRTQASYDNW